MIPDADTVLALEPEELAGVLLSVTRGKMSKKSKSRGRTTHGKIGRPPERRGRPAKGRITKLATGMGHGFIQAGDREVFFHRADLIEIKFNDLVVGGAVSFEVIEDPVSGPQAIHVRGPAGAHD